MKKTLMIGIAALSIGLLSCSKETPTPLTGSFLHVDDEAPAQSNLPVLLDVLYMNSFYMTCTTEVDLPLADEEYWIGTFENIPPTGSRPQASGCFYTFYAETHDTGNPWHMDYKFKDINCGTIEAGDTLIPVQVRYSGCGSTITLQEHEICTVTISGDTVDLGYHDCILPLNGISGTVHITFIQ